MRVITTAGSTYRGWTWVPTWSPTLFRTYIGRATAANTGRASATAFCHDIADRPTAATMTTATSAETCTAAGIGVSTQPRPHIPKTPTGIDATSRAFCRKS